MVREDIGEPRRRPSSTKTMELVASRSFERAMNNDDSEEESLKPQQGKTSFISRILGKRTHNRAAKKLNSFNSALPMIIAVAAFLLLAFFTLITLRPFLNPDTSRSSWPQFYKPQSDSAKSSNTLEILLHPEKHTQRASKVIHYHWTITSDFRAPDGVRKNVHLINGRSCLFLPNRRSTCKSDSII